MSNDAKKYLGIDWGTKRIGLALADEETSLALPYKTVANLNEDEKNRPGFGRRRNELGFTL
ncbi:MAG: Holliday junction resolvase RuvX [Candidatus Falkowbacteria bacterium]|nr:Holliday junction resolvase RuvX [Candidatus Falkowbacteria bacterium]